MTREMQIQDLARTRCTEYEARAATAAWGGHYNLLFNTTTKSSSASDVHVGYTSFIRGMSSEGSTFFYPNACRRQPVQIREQGARGYCSKSGLGWGLHEGMLARRGRDRETSQRGQSPSKCCPSNSSTLPCVRGSHHLASRVPTSHINDSSLSCA